jgi:hypothetical protein
MPWIWKYGIVCALPLTLNLVIEITPNPKESLCTQKWNGTLPRHEFCGKELGRGCDPNIIYNCTCTLYLSLAMSERYEKIDNITRDNRSSAR